MANAADLRRLAMALPNTVEYPHFGRTAFKVTRTYVTLAEDGLSANIKFRPEEQEFKCQIAPEVFQSIANGWGRQGWTLCHLPHATEFDLEAALLMAYQHALGKPKRNL